MPFELGHPLGAANNPAFQKKVLLAVLKLLEAPNGPVLVDFPEDAPISNSNDGPIILACPYIPLRKESDNTETELCGAFRTEMRAIRPWYDIAVTKRERTTVGISKLELDEMGKFICSFLTGIPDNPRKDISLGYELRFAADDLKAYYYEAAGVQPGMESVTSEALTKWFWEETAAGKILIAVRDVCLKSQIDSLVRVGKGQLLPAKLASRMAK